MAASQIIKTVDDYEIQVYSAPAMLNYPFHFDKFFFNEQDHIAQQSNEPYYTFYLLNKKKQVVEARFTFFQKGQEGISPARASFGSVDLNPQLDLYYLESFSQEVEKFAQNKGIQSLRITHYPVAYAPESSQILHYVFLRLGYKLVSVELNYHISIHNSSLENLMHLSAKRRLRKCLNANFTFQQWDEPDLKFVYEFIKANRERKGYPMTLTYEAMLALFERFPRRFLVFTVQTKLPSPEIAALTVLIIINKDILYNFYPADATKYLNYSPVVMLNEGLYRYAQNQGFKLLDLGTATDKGEPNFGLIRFKKNLGAQVSLKGTFKKELL